MFGRLPTRGWAPAYGLLLDRSKLIDLPIPEVYDLSRDHAESANLAAREPLLFDDLRGRLRRQRSADPGVARESESAEVRERLASLGYVVTSAGMKERPGLKIRIVRARCVRRGCGRDRTACACRCSDPS